MAAETNPQASNEQDITAHSRDYAGFITLLKWTVVVTAIIAAAVIYLISN